MVVIVNKTKIEYEDNYAGAIRDLMVFHLPNVKFQKASHAKNNLIEQAKQFKEALEIEYSATTKEIKRKISPLKRKLNFFIEGLEPCKTNLEVQNKLYNLILSLEKLGVLYGFSALK